MRVETILSVTHLDRRLRYNYNYHYIADYLGPKHKRIHFGGYEAQNQALSYASYDKRLMLPYRI